jgi:YD repeat-containing protein
MSPLQRQVGGGKREGSADGRKDPERKTALKWNARSRLQTTTTEDKTKI